MGNYCNLLKHVLSNFARMEKEQTKQNKKRKTRIGSELKLLGCRPIKGVVCDWLLFRGTCILNLDDTSKTYGPHEKKTRLNGYGLLKTLYYHFHFQVIFSFSFCHVKVQATRKYIPRDIVALFLFFFNTGKHPQTNRKGDGLLCYWSRLVNVTKSPNGLQDEILVTVGHFCHIEQIKLYNCCQNGRGTAILVRYVKIILRWPLAELYYTTSTPSRFVI